MGPDSPGVVDGFCHLFADERIAIGGDDFAKVHRWRDNIHVVKRLDELLNLRVFKAGVREHSGNVRIYLPCDVK